MFINMKDIYIYIPSIMISMLNIASKFTLEGKFYIYF